MTLFASDVMIKDVITVSDAMPIKEVTKMFSEKRITGAPVVNAAGELVGVLSETDIIRKTSSIGAWSPNLAGQIMTKPAVTVSPNETLQRVCELMHNRRIHRVVVAEGTQICGIITTMDILRAIAQHSKESGQDAFES
ncbi:MAG TPA: CBS domain-containing protein [Blastocatellia bacterium]|nr:CBS domain-containing protein [Blastocatellia bacterium]HMV86636.1 CBS domain-containing protein [Blastocatellia bacterium]HMX30492.1 CBS domain-containing protein [Blastocatellia bacterium]HMY71201.1 CBS domain-containing protein [Blastocatellia bacterium]HMZ20763.1 CBS domain-containing protein [Blastocatellia bacterium]